MFKNILVICTGNICRSPIAEGWLKHVFQKECMAIDVSSAGTHALENYAADPHAIAVLKAMGIDISGHKARQATKEMILNSDLILVMEQHHKTEVENICKSARGRVFLLGHWDQIEIPDPYRQPIKAFEYVFTLIQQSSEQWRKRL